jgi:hypothetical protein
LLKKIDSERLLIPEDEIAEVPRLLADFDGRSPYLWPFSARPQ